MSHVKKKKKIYERILEPRLRAETEDKVEERRRGFTPNRGTMVLGFSLKIVGEKLGVKPKSVQLSWI